MTLTNSTVCSLVHDSRHSMTTAVTANAPPLSQGDCVQVSFRSTKRETLLKPLTRLLSVLMGATTQASFH